MRLMWPGFGRRLEVDSGADLYAKSPLVDRRVMAGRQEDIDGAPAQPIQYGDLRVSTERVGGQSCLFWVRGHQVFLCTRYTLTFVVLPLHRSCPMYLRASTCHSSTPSLWSSARLMSANASPLYNQLVEYHQRQQCRAKRRSVTDKVVIICSRYNLCIAWPM